MRPWLMLTLFMLVSPHVLAVYKCQSHGNVTYTDIPCGASQSELPSPPPPSDPSRARQQAQVDREHLSAIEKEAERTRRDIQKQLMAKEKAAKPVKQKCRALALQKRWSEEDANSASTQVSEKAYAMKKQAIRMAERFEAECGTD